MLIGRSNHIWSLLFCLLMLYTAQLDGAGTNIRPSRRLAYAKYIGDHYSHQLTDPEAKKRKSFSQFGYGLTYFNFPLFPVTEFIDPEDFGEHSYGEPGIKEKNGSLYTCRGGFMDFSHIRASADWTVYLTFRIITENKDFELPYEGGDLFLHFNSLSALSLDDIASMAQKIAFERLEWHEIASWHYHQPNYTFDERQSAFTPEDTYSNFLGTTIGRRIALRILKQKEDLPYSQIASEEIKKMVESLTPVSTKKQSREAYDIVDRNKQIKLPEAERNKDIWWDSKVLFRDERYVFKRSINIGPIISPWLVPHQESIGCPVRSHAQVFKVPQRTTPGISLYNYYEFKIVPDSVLFYSKREHKELHPPFPPFISQNMQATVDFVAKEIQKELSPGFSRRDKNDPEKHFKKLKKAFFK
jgi:hypothetical protein